MCWRMEGELEIKGSIIIKCDIKEIITVAYGKKQLCKNGPTETHALHDTRKISQPSIQGGRFTLITYF